MKTIKELREESIRYNEQYGNNSIVLSEELHKELQGTLDSNLPPKHKLTNFTRNVRSLIKRGENTGLENDKPLKGSSRAVFLSKENHPIYIDGQKTSIPTATKIAFPGKLDIYTGHHQLLGEMQNEQEADGYANFHSVLRHDRDDRYTHNPDGILAPMLSHHEDHHHITFGRVEKATAAGIKEATKTPDFPNGITHNQIYDAINHSYNEANGIKNYSSNPEADAKRKKIKAHPFVEELTHFSGDTGMHPGDMVKSNLGIWEHPINKTKHLVVSDYGGSTEVLKHYNNARRKLRESMRGY